MSRLAIYHSLKTYPLFLSHLAALAAEEDESDDLNALSLIRPSPSMRMLPPKGEPEVGISSHKHTRTYDPLQMKKHTLKDALRVQTQTCTQEHMHAVCIEMRPNIQYGLSMHKYTQIHTITHSQNHAKMQKRKTHIQDSLFFKDFEGGKEGRTGERVLDAEAHIQDSLSLSHP